MQLELGADDYDGAPGIVDSLAEEVLSEASLLAFEHVAQGFERPVARAEHGAAVAAGVEQRVHGFLKHPLFVSHYDLGRPELYQPLQAVVAVDDAPVEVVEVARCVSPAFERDKRS